MKKEWVLTAVLSAGMVLAACGGGETAESGASPAPDNGTTLTISIEENYNEFVEAIKGDFEKEHDVTIEIINMAQLEQAEALPLDGPSGIGPDITMFPYDRIGGLALQGHLAEVSIPDDGRFDEKDRQQVTVEGTTYGVPFNLETLVLYYNKDLIAEPPATFEELEELATDEQYAFEAESGKNTAFLANWIDFYYSYGVVAAYDGYVFGGKGTDPQDIGLNTPESVEAIEYIGSWYQNIWPQGMQDVNTASDFISSSFVEGNSAAIINGPWGAPDYEEAGLNFGVTKIPTLPNGEEYQPFAGGRGWVISSYSDNIALAQEWLDYVSTHENQLTFYETVKEIPANQQTREVILEEGTEVEVAVLEQYETSDPMPNIPEMAEVWENAQNMLFDVASGAKNAQQSADDAVETIEQQIEQKY